MSDEEKVSKYYGDLDNIFYKITNILNNYEKSQILQNYFFGRFESFIYANLINNFFKNLNQKNIEDFNLSTNRINVINKEYETLQKEIRSVLSFSSTNKMNEKHYSDFKSDLKNKFPDFLKIISEIEKLTSNKGMPKYLNKKRKEMEKTGKTNASLETIVVTKALEGYVNVHHRLPIGLRAKESLKSIAMKYLESMSQDVMKNLEKDMPRMLREHRKIRDESEDRLYTRWKKPLDSLESLIVICLESGEDKKKKLSKGKNIINPKKVSLIKIHARAVQISYEILALIRGGFADGAHARWRSLHELAIITFFLRDNSDEVSERYLAHNMMKKFKESENYQKHHQGTRLSVYDKKRIRHT